MIDVELTLTCTDNGKSVKSHVLNYKEKAYLDVAINTVKVRLIYHKNGIYIGSMSGYEFTIKENTLPSHMR